MKLPVILISFLLVFTFLNQSFAEVYTTGSAADNNGNIIVIGYCLGNVRIAGDEYTITTPSSFILKLNSGGEKIWVKFINSTQSIKANAVVVDSSGNIYITGEFSGTANFDTQFLTAQNSDAFIVKLNESGNITWLKQGISPNNARGNDIVISNDGSVYVCGYAATITFNSLTISGGPIENCGYTVKIGNDGTTQLLFHSLDNAYNLTLDSDENIIVCGGNYSSTWSQYYAGIKKFSSQGNIIWSKGGQWMSSSPKYFPIADNYKNIYTSLLGADWTHFVKLDSNGTPFLPITSFLKMFVNDLKLKDNNSLLLIGNYLTNAQFGDSVLSTSGGMDAFIAKIDTGFNPIWIKHCGGLLSDEMINISQLNDGSIVCNGNFSGTITVDTFPFSGGIGADDLWAAVGKYDNDGNLIWFKKIAENFSVQSTINWFPLEKGNKWHLYGHIFGTYYGNSVAYLLHNFMVTDSAHISDKKYYKINGFLGYNNTTFLRFDKLTQRLILLNSNLEYTFMDFSKSAGESFAQLQPDGSFLTAIVIEDTLLILNDSVIVKGFSISSRNPTGKYYFSPNIGWISQDETQNFWYEKDLQLIEYFIYSDSSTIHTKHTSSASIVFQPIIYIPHENTINQSFTILHPYSKHNYPASNGYFSYIQNSYFQSFYYNSTDTIWNNNFNIPQTTEIDFSLDYQFDTTKYNQGYHLYYRIAAVDKGIIADTFYSPQTGYYKLFWKDSTTSVTQTEFQALTYSLSQNYPNPFNPSAKIVFTIPQREIVTLKVYDILGSEIATLVNKELDAGKYDVEFSGKDLSSGIYIYQIIAGAFRESKKMILLR